MVTKKCVAMLLAGGQGSRLGVLTKNTAKPAVPFGGKYRIIDFPLSNCTNSGIDTVGVLTQYKPLKLNSYIGIGQPWDLDRLNGGLTILPPYMKQSMGEWYSGTANAIYQNIEFIEAYQPEYVLILSGDQIYKMDYSAMLRYHETKKADVTIAILEVPWEEANRFGIMNTDETNRIYEFVEKPKSPISNKASMGIYIFNWKKLLKYLIDDQNNPNSSNDFGRDIIPKMLNNNERMFAYPFKGYWRDVGTIQSLWEANMDLLEESPELDLYDPGWRIYSRNPVEPPHFIALGANVRRCIVTEGGMIYGDVYHSVLFSGVTVGRGSKVTNSILMPNVRVGENVIIENAIIAENAMIGDNCHIGYRGTLEDECKLEPKNSDDITVIGENLTLPNGFVLDKGVMIDIDNFRAYQAVV
ncbi:glucose-1-phosphate adenylyltransferase [Lachnospiraceae bacterium MD1]|jgi:glucose-1-phosphate adenylyltransferase|uniref:Glucose-1-phosphate adenylyltransferase n=1 Tax=Variimorphobacter saccharofermentans TaxID=2755051 RepID=A0A839K4X2_9FIRM|nr:glucose-1-phosphate adenylyltransferase [Variimorphobacter saccharofermentans]MBB2184397.1 glucose-1-phosphate adenylyltransferase [Variimorphobacter saccharofermentans]